MKNKFKKGDLVRHTEAQYDPVNGDRGIVLNVGKMKMRLGVPRLFVNVHWHIGRTETIYSDTHGWETTEVIVSA